VHNWTIIHPAARGRRKKLMGIRRRRQRIPRTTSSSRGATVVDAWLGPKQALANQRSSRGQPPTTTTAATRRCNEQAEGGQRRRRLLQKKVGEKAKALRNRLLALGPTQLPPPPPSQSSTQHNFHFPVRLLLLFLVLARTAFACSFAPQLSPTRKP
jgi:hypothetical protein